MRLAAQRRGRGDAGYAPRTLSTPPAVRDNLTLPALASSIELWLLDGDGRLSPKTMTDRRWLCGKLVWWVRRENLVAFGREEMSRFLHYVKTGHTTKAGRWGDVALGLKGDFKEVRPRTVRNYFCWLRTFFTFCVTERLLDVSPLEQMKTPRFTADQVQPFSKEQVAALLAAARTQFYPERDEAIVLLLLDTGARAGEVTALDMDDFSYPAKTLRVRGKGDTHRTLYVTAKTANAIVKYLKGEYRSENDPLFTSAGGRSVGGRLTTHGLGQIIVRLGKTAGIEGVRCSLHTFRHTFGIEYLRNGGDPLTLQSLFGHTSLQMTARYVALSATDRRKSHAQFSPVAKMGR